jgi:hypothetical protein
MPSNATTKRIAHRIALVAAALWWGYAFFSTSFFTNVSGTGLAVYMLGLPICYALAYLGARGIAWVIASLWS